MENNNGLAVRIERPILLVGYSLFAISFFLPAMESDGEWTYGIQAFFQSMGLCIPAIALSPSLTDPSSWSGEESLVPGIYYGLLWLVNVPVFFYFRARLVTTKRRPRVHFLFLIFATGFANPYFVDSRGLEQATLVIGYHTWFFSLVLISLSAGIRCFAASIPVRPQEK
jgi:hypothetical protein